MCSGYKISISKNLKYQYPTKSKFKNTCFILTHSLPQARLQAISILVYSNAGNDILQNLLYDGLIEELVDVLGVTDPRLTDIKAAALRTLTAIIHLERTPRINAIIDATGMSEYDI